MGIFTSGKADENRLQTIQDFTDQLTHEGIAACDLPTNADCLEVGAGQGSVALWLAQRFTHGTVVAVDLDTEALEPLAQAQAYLQAVKSDISILDYPAESFDLIHARFVLSHLANRDELVRKFATWLRPGGYLVVTDAYQLPTETSPHPIVARVSGRPWTMRKAEVWICSGCALPRRFSPGRVWAMWPTRAAPPISVAANQIAGHR
ncbi:class I SAM-dependent methyltransferase [Mycobacteroides chelonae]|uniref:class I SAM-dependent methyltransferase n=1 Tax=Mycobacteroides chelonae TaxID=1774 RepID=UPI003AAA9631